MSARWLEVQIPIPALRTATVIFFDSGGRRVMVDASMDRQGAAQISGSGLLDGGLDYVLFTHMHIDHIGGFAHLSERLSAETIMGRKDAEIVYRAAQDINSFTREISEEFAALGVPESLVSQMTSLHPMVRGYGTYSRMEFDILVDTRFRIPGTSLEAVVYPGHTPSSLCLFDTSTGEVATGDHILERITPNISFYDMEVDYLGSYLESLSAFSSAVSRVAYPGHGPPFQDPAGRARRIMEHHTLRSSQILSVLGEKKTAYQVADSIPWKRGVGLSGLDINQKIFAIAEAEAHLRHMVATGTLRLETENGVRVYMRA
ncbi:hypothetical protein GCM10007108_17050 [Thermogymnomonas acidicola]|uniref:Metallo-beta-lactamase domain-containing protein n=1 Tax=Thermogymnomonas acidicola TaxID=399579 RepID=A0AA37BTM7_9ARCH|nr:MBL fold metallo-hydrolase [Thermogymnomonas acidicola]GGM79408.1 hypothetical protein GCM10007108_17050 [Thermogymnomonas acidicola]